MATAPKTKVSVKHLKIDKDQSTMLTVIIVATVIVVFGLVATKSMITKAMYQRRAINAQRQVANQLKSNYGSAQTLLTQYQSFATQNPNIVGGAANGTANLDGNNAQIVLDALPSTYDAPALATSVEKILTGRTVTINSLNVTDDPTLDSDDAMASPQPKPVTFSFIGTSSYSGTTQLLQDFERSIRPFDVNTLEITGSDSSLKISVGMTTYYQPATSLDLQASKEVK